MNDPINTAQSHSWPFPSVDWDKILINRLLSFVLVNIAFFVLSAPAASAQVLNNPTLRLQLDVSREGIPIIKEVYWSQSGKVVFSDSGTPEGLKSWVPAKFIPASSDKVVTPLWEVTEDANFLRAEASRTLLRGLSITWIVELPKEGGLFRLHVRIKNEGNESQAVNWFPAWAASWSLSDGAQWIRWWRSLSFAQVEKSLRAQKEIKLGSQLHSSEEGAENPYWVIGGGTERLYFGLEWSGGWRARIKRKGSGINFSASLPSEETQLVLNPQESIEGPVLIVMPTTGADDIFHRHSWMTQRLALGKVLYGGPDRHFPLVYNHWYSVRRDVDGEFLRRQVEAMAPYSLDAFVVDAGWYERGQWSLDRTKFAEGEFESLMASVKASGMKTGIWTCPQYQDVPDGEPLPREIEHPILYNSFFGAYLLDLANSDMEGRILSHVAMLRELYSVDWWKFDAAWFAEDSRAGVMKNVVAFQNSLKTLRAAEPDLFIESCKGGGRMINELTLLSCQMQWLRDGGEKGLVHARQNIETVLGAMGIVFPTMAYSWTNRLDEMNQNDDELTRLYCRSSMAGTWGISSDLSKIGNRQRNVVLEEIQRYRQLNQIKQDCLYDLQLPRAGARTAGVTFYDALQQKAGGVIYRWDGQGSFDQEVRFKNLKAESHYVVRDVDRGSESRVLGEDLMEKGIIIPFGPERMSALVFVEQAQ